jgi:hypothetical protein
LQSVWTTTAMATGAALAAYAMGRLRRDGEIDREADGGFGVGAVVSMIAASASAGCVAFALQTHDFHAGVAVSVAVAWALSGSVWRAAMGRWRHAVGTVAASLSLALAAHWYADRASVEWLLTAILIASYLAVLDMLGFAYVLGLFALIRVHAPEVMGTQGFWPRLLAACLPGLLTWIGISVWRMGRARRAAQAGQPVVESAGDGQIGVDAGVGAGGAEPRRAVDVVPGISRFLRRINFDFGFLGAAAVIVGVPFMSNQVWPMAGVESGNWLVLVLVAMSVGIYNLMTRPKVGEPGWADVLSITIQLGALVMLYPVLRGISFVNGATANAMIYLGLMLFALLMLLLGVFMRPRGTAVKPDDIRLLGLQLLLMFPMAFGWSWMIRGIRSDAQWWAAFLLPLIVWVSRARERVQRSG